eukprot:tig00001029_g6411.t1
MHASQVTRISGGPPPRGLARLRAHPSGLIIAATGPPGRLRRFRARLPNEAEVAPFGAQALAFGGRLVDRADSMSGPPQGL